MSDTEFSDTRKSSVMLKLCLGSIRDYAREVAAAGRRPNYLVQPTHTLPDSDEAKPTELRRVTVILSPITTIIVKGIAIFRRR
jgi:hypothetical protein